MSDNKGKNRNRGTGNNSPTNTAAMTDKEVTGGVQAAELTETAAVETAATETETANVSLETAETTNEESPNEETPVVEASSEVPQGEVLQDEALKAKNEELVVKKRLSALMEENENHKSVIDRARATIRDAEERRSTCLGAIVELSGHKKFRYRKREVTIVSRKNKTTGKVLNFERGDGDPSKLLEVE